MGGPHSRERRAGEMAHCRGGTEAEARGGRSGGHKAAAAVAGASGGGGGAGKRVAGSLVAWRGGQVALASRQWPVEVAERHRRLLLLALTHGLLLSSANGRSGVV